MVMAVSATLRGLGEVVRWGKREGGRQQATQVDSRSTYRINRRIRKSWSCLACGGRTCRGVVGIRLMGDAV